MIFCYLISPDTAKFNKLKHLIFIFYQNNFAVVVYKDISMISLSSRASFIKNTQKNILTITLGICLVLTVLLANVIESQNFHIQRVFFYLPMLGLVVNIFGNILSTISQEWPCTLNELNCHKYCTKHILELNQTPKPNKDWQNILKSFFCEALIHWLRTQRFFTLSLAGSFDAES